MVGLGTGVAGFIALLPFVGFIALLPFVGFIALLPLGMLLAGVLAGVDAGVLTGAGVDAGLLAFALLAGTSPHAMPRALKPRTVESTITFFILLITPNLSQRIKPVARPRLIKHSRFALNSFFFKANDNIEIAGD